MKHDVFSLLAESVVLCPHGDRIAQKYEDCCSLLCVLLTKQVDTKTVFYVIKFLLKRTAYKKCLKEERRS